ncbi:hypothetical protein BDW71DRAFT_173229 [Aspergillus fruticulosus]
MSQRDPPTLEISPSTNHPSTMSSTSIPADSDSQLQPHDGTEREESASLLQSHLNSLHSFTTPLSSIVQALHSLLLNPNHHLKPSISPTGKRLITLTLTTSDNIITSLTGAADLNILGNIHLKSGTSTHRSRHVSCMLLSTNPSKSSTTKARTSYARV